MHRKALVLIATLSGGWSLQSPFADLGVPDIQAMMRRDIGRRYTELQALGWLGRTYLVAPAVFDALLPSVFRLEGAEPTSFERKSPEAVLCSTLKESSIVKRGIPIQLRLETAGNNIVSAALVGFGCDVARASPKPAELLSNDEAHAILTRIRDDPSTKRLVVRAITRTIFRDLDPVAAAAQGAADLVCCGPEISFLPRKDLWAREGSSEKWLQQVAGYYFAASRLQEVRFASSKPGGVHFLFYFDPAEPVNSEDVRRNVNPEVVFCSFEDLSRC